MTKYNNNTHVEEVSYAKSMPAWKLNQARQLGTAFAQLSTMRSDIPQLSDVQDSETFIKSYSKASQAFKKAITGASALTGNALVGQTFEPLDFSMITIEQGNAFVESGVQFFRNLVGQKTIPAFNNFGDFIPSTPGTPLTNDVAVNKAINNPLNPALYQAEIPLYEDPALTDYLHDLGRLYAVFEQVLEVKKQQLADDLLAQAITANPTGITIKPVSSSTYFPITLSIKQLVAELSKFGRPKIYVSNNGLSAVINEQDANGQFASENVEGIGNGKFRFSTPNGVIPEKGLVGFMAGAEVHIVPKIKSTYTVNGSNAVTAQTGGSHTIAAVGIPQMAGIGRGRPEHDFVQVYTSQDSLTVFRSSEPTIGAKTYMGATVANPYGWGYYAFPA